MAFQSTPNAAEVFIEYGYVNGGKFGNTLWFTNPGFNLTDLETLAASVRANVLPGIVSLLSSDVTFSRITATDKRTFGGNQAIDTNGTGTPGGNTAEVEDIATSLVLTLRTNRIGRSFRGRQYVRGIPGTQITNGLILAGFYNSIRQAYIDIKEDAAVQGWTMVVRSGQVDGVVQNPAITTPVESVVVRNAIMGHQRLTNRRP